MKIKVFFFVLISFVLIICLADGCKKEDHSRFQATWSAKDPILAPFNIRKHEKDLGNLIVNPSFESGKIYYEENSIESFDINGWRPVGDNIEWVNTENIKYNSNEVYAGTHAIKISRDNVDETEKTGSGVISDYIKVIPGNYSLKLFLRLEHICPNQARIGTKMYDAINIRLQYFDKNKIEIDGTEFNPYQNNRIDNTFKSLTLSNYSYIDKLDWGEIHGKTANFPYYNGDIPDKTRYVKIFIGLKGSGKMWVDKVDLRYTRQNFTMYERLKPYYDSSYSAYDLIFPQPKQIVKKNPIEYYNLDTGVSPIIVIPRNANKDVVQCANKLQKLVGAKIKSFVQDYNTSKIEIVNQIDLSQVNANQLVLSIGENHLHSKNKALLPDSILKKHEQSYYIKTIDNKSNVVFVNSNGASGFTYVINTFNQLLDAKDLIFHNATIIDYPDFLQRAYIIHELNGDVAGLSTKLNLLNKYKLNYPYFKLKNIDEKNYPFKPVSDFTSDMGFEKYGVIIDLEKIGNESIANREMMDCLDGLIANKKSPESILISAQYHQGLKSKITETGFDTLTCSRKSMQDGHVKMLNSVHQLTRKRKSSRKNIEFIAPWSSLDRIDKGLGNAEFYFYDFINRIHENTSMYWTGGSYCSTGIDNAEFNRMNTIIGKAPILLDNSLYTSDLQFNSESVKNYYAGKIRALSLFEPYYLETFDGFFEQCDKKKVLLNLNSLSELNTIRILTAANYYWNTSAYNPDQSLWIVLNNLYGRENAMNLINFNDSYYGLNEICQKMEIDGLQNKSLRIADLFASSLKKHYSLLENELLDEKLMEEIRMLKKEQLERYNNIISSVNKN